MENSNPDLEKIKNLIESCEYSQAQLLLENLYKNNQNNIEIIDLLSDVYFNQDKIEKSKKLILKSINLSPNTNPEKYMTLGQIINNPEESVKYYNQAISLYKQQLNENPNNNDLKESIASGLASIASLYMTTDLCDKNNAEEICENSIREGLNINNNNIDILLQLSNLRILRKRDDEAKSTLNKIMNLINVIDITDEKFPDHGVLLNIANNYAEINMYEQAIQILNILVKIDDEDINCWYLIAFDNYQIHNFKEAYDIVLKIFDIYNKNPTKFNGFEDIISASEELKNNLEQKCNLVNEHEEILKNNDEEDNISEEDIEMKN